MTSNAEIMVFNEIKRRALTKEQVIDVISEHYWRNASFDDDVVQIMNYLYGRGYVVIPLVEFSNEVVPPKSKYDNKKDTFKMVKEKNGG